MKVKKVTHIFNLQKRFQFAGNTIPLLLVMSCVLMFNMYSVTEEAISSV